MKGHKNADRHPGPLPEIRCDGRDITFEFDALGRQPGSRLVIRCDEDGAVFARIDGPDIDADGRERFRGKP